MEIDLGHSVTEKFQHLRLTKYDVSPTMSESSTPTSVPSTPNTDGYDIAPIKVEDTERAILFLRRFFFRDEPLNVEQNLLETPEAICSQLEEYSVKSIAEGVSIMAVSPTGDIVGICLNGVVSRDDPPEDEPVCENKKFAKILKLLDTVEKQADVFGQFPEVQKVIVVKILSVDDTWRGKGIAKTLIDRTREYASKSDIELIRVDCTSHYSARAVARLGFNCIYILKYSEYQEDGKPVFTPEPPHNEVKVYVQRAF